LRPPAPNLQSQTAPLSEKVVSIYRGELKCNFEQIDDIFDGCLEEALDILGEKGIKDYLEGASLVCMIGRGVEPVLVFLEEIPQIAARLGESVINLIAQSVWKMSRSPNGNAIPAFIQSMPEAARRLGSAEQLQHYLDVVFHLMESTTGSIHGFHTTIPSPGLPAFLEKSSFLLNNLSIQGIRNWVDYGIANYKGHPDNQIGYFSLESADSKAVIQRERHGTLFVDNERKLSLYLQALWEIKPLLVPFSQGFDETEHVRPYYDVRGLRMPDVYDDSVDSSREIVTGLQRYFALLSHVAAHCIWTQQVFADNYSPFQRYGIETLEDCRVEYLAMLRYPGLRKLWLALHPVPVEDDCDSSKESCIRHRMTMLSRAILDPDHGYQNTDIIDFSERFRGVMQEGESCTKDMAQLAISFVARTRRQEDQLAQVYFKDTHIKYRDDNRHMWLYIEESDDEEQFDEHRDQDQEQEVDSLPPRHYPEWDYNTQTYRPDWVSLYESLHPSGNAADIDSLLAKHSALAKRLKQVFDLLKPQNYVRIRYQEEGSELDLDVALRSLIDFKAGSQPDPRINMSHRHDDRDISVYLLLDLSASLAEIPSGCNQTILELSQEAVSLLGWAIEGLGDPFAIAGFYSNTRHEVRYQHLKGFSEHWGEEVKARLAAMDAGFSTRMGAAMRHAGHYLEQQKTDKKLLLILTDGEPADIDVKDERLLIEDTRKAVMELDQQGIYSYCITLDANADDYVSDIFGGRYTVIDHVDRLPQKLPELFISLTR
jgi:nitric oxide reductase NorD protein